MNPVIWSSMQSPEVIQAIDYMLPHFVDEEELDIMHSMSTLHSWKTDQVDPSFWNQPWMGPLSAAAAVIFLIPDPLVFSVGYAIGGPIGGTVAVALVNGVVVALILLDYFI